MECLFERFPAMVKRCDTVSEEMGMKGYVDLFCFFELLHPIFFSLLREGIVPNPGSFIVGMIKVHPFQVLNETLLFMESSIVHKERPDVITFDTRPYENVRQLDEAIAIGGDFDLFKFYFLQGIGIPNGRGFIDSLVDSKRLIEFVARTLEEYQMLLSITTVDIVGATTLLRFWSILRRNY